MVSLLPACQKPVYENTDLSSRFLLSDAPFSLRGYIQHCNDTVWPLFSHLESAVREGANQHEKAFGKTSKDMFQVIISKFSLRWIKMWGEKTFESILQMLFSIVFLLCHLFLFKGYFLQQSRSQTEIHECHAQHC